MPRISLRYGFCIVVDPGDIEVPLIHWDECLEVMIQAAAPVLVIGSKLPSLTAIALPWMMSVMSWSVDVVLSVAVYCSHLR